MAFDTPAFPTIDFTRIMGQPGLTAHEVFTLAALPACIMTATPVETADETAGRAKAFADAALSHRRAQG